MTKEEKFFNALRDIFIGAEVEGESGYINLMRIKSRYFQNVIQPALKKDIDEALKPFPEFREELFDKLYTFFHRYFSETGSIYFSYTPFHQNVYEKVYTDDRDVILFWKTRPLYYVKTDRLFRSMEVEVDGFRFFFDVSKLEHKKAFEKKEIIYELEEKREDGTIVLTVSYSERGRKTDVVEILRSLRKSGANLTEEILQRAFRVFEKQSEVDYFINKNAKEFLREQFNLWMYQYIFSGESEWTERRIKQLQVLKDIAFKIIDFISQFEDELVKIWNKPRFVLNSGYVITLDRIAEREGGMEVIGKILKHENFPEQVKEWEELGIVGDDFKGDEILDLPPLIKEVRLKEEYKFLPIDTKYFKDLELEILGLFDDLDNSLDGWLIKSENYQALNTILPKFREKVQTIYIDPPYNTGSDEFIYKDRFRHASWLTMLEGRLSIAKALMKSEGIIFISIGDTTKTNVHITSSSKIINLMNEIFGENNWVATFVRKTGIAPKRDIKHIANVHDYIVSYAKSIDKLIVNEQPSTAGGFVYEDEYVETRGRYRLNKLDRGSIRYSESLDYPIIAPDGTEIWPGGDPEDKRWTWRWSKEKVEWGIKNGYIIFKKSKAEKWQVYYKEYELVDNELNPRARTNPFDSLILDCENEKGNKEIENLFSKRVFEYPKPTALLIHLLKIGSFNNSIVLDFFAGSGTTAHAVMKFNKEDGGTRKFILVEMAYYFYDVIIPRLKKLAYSLNWESGKPQNIEGMNLFIKYYELEQYEDTLRRVKYEDSDLFLNSHQDPYNQYIFMKDLKMLEALEIDYQNNKVKVDLSKLYDNIDVPETLSNLLGKWIKRITSDYVEFEDGEKVNIKELDYKLIKPLIWW